MLERVETDTVNAAATSPALRPSISVFSVCVYVSVCLSFSHRDRW